ncbi:7159_t:CDS:2 [Cetraspora pellucida]|uniref:Endoglucanase n=1 Tax=Cetraspora pellucida TaxID=1433469 RepID=A0A9N9E020_9GLOM|nr:7159_t:CDS:2 [Cetraspora pellucida]
MILYIHYQKGTLLILLTVSLILLTSLTQAQTSSNNYALPPPMITGIPQGPSNNTYPNPEYARLVAYSLYFYEAQRSGKLPTNNRVSWRHDSALNDGQDVNLDLSGGYYDAGDYVKFTFPLSWTITTIAWGALEWNQGYQLANQTQYLMDMVKWGTDWFIKASSNTNSTEYQYLYVMVGNLNIDHNYFGPDTNIPTPRPSSKVDTSSHGTDAAAGVAAAFAASSILFQSNDSNYSNTLLTYAKNLYAFAETTPFTLYQNSAPLVKEGYSSTNYADELVWGALWLYRATNDTTYLNKAVNYFNSNSFSKKVFNWDEKSGGNYVLFAQLFQQSGQDSSRWKSLAEKYLDTIIKTSGGDCTFTDGGLFWCDGDSDDASLTVSLGAAFLSLVYSPIATSNTKSREYINFALSQIDYTLGKNPLNTPYVIGVHPNSPQNPHHAGAHGGSDMNNPPQTLNILYGGIVGGPDKGDDFSDSRSDYAHTEVAMDYNAAFQSLMAYQMINSHTDPYYVNVPPGIPKRRKISTGVIIAIVMLCLLLLIIAAVLFWKRKAIVDWWKRRRQTKSNGHYEYGSY